MSHSEVSEKDSLVKLCEQAIEALEKNDDTFDVETVILAAHRAITHQKKEEIASQAAAIAAEKAEKERESFFVVMALNHALRDLRTDRDIVSTSNWERARLLILEFRSEEVKQTKYKNLWLDSMTKGPLNGIEKEDIWPSEEGLNFCDVVRDIIHNGTEYYKSQKKAATHDELINSVKRLERQNKALTDKLDSYKKSNTDLRKRLDDIFRISEWRRKRND